MRRQAAALTRGRQASESRMRATCKIERPGAAATNASTGVVSATLTAIYTGKCWITDFNAHPSTFDLVGAQVSINQPILKVPTSAPVIRVGDQITVTADPDGTNAGKVFRVVAIRSKS